MIFAQILGNQTVQVYGKFEEFPFNRHRIIGGKDYSDRVVWLFLFSDICRQFPIAVIICYLQKNAKQKTRFRIL